MPWDEAYDLVIGRGHSAAILKQKDNQVPVLEIPITGYDILRALLKAKEQYHAYPELPSLFPLLKPMTKLF